MFYRFCFMASKGLSWVAQDWDEIHLREPRTISWWSLDLDLCWTVYTSLWGFAFGLFAITLFISPKMLIRWPLVGKKKKKTHCCYFYIWNQNPVHLSGHEFFFKHVDFVCVSVQNGAVAMASLCMISVKVVLIESIKRWAQKNMFIEAIFWWNC